MYAKVREHGAPVQGTRLGGKPGKRWTKWQHVLLVDERVRGKEQWSDEPKTLLNQMPGVDRWVDVRVGLHRIIASIS